MMPSREEVYRALVERHGEALQKRLEGGRVAVCGLGGLGSNIAILLARAGVGHLHLIDFDRVDLTNLNRQQYRVNQIGQYKTEALREILGEIAPYAEVRIDTVKVTEENLAELLHEDEILCEAFDDPAAKAMMVSGAMELFSEKPIVAASGMAGLGSPNTIVTKKRLRNLYLSGDECSEVSEDVGLISARVAVCAAHQATTILRLLAGETEV